MKWRDLTPADLSEASRHLADHLGDLRPDRASIREESGGVDLVAVLGAVRRRIDREAKRRQEIAFGSRPGRGAKKAAG